MSEAFQEDRSVLSRASRAPDRTVRVGDHPEQVVDLWMGDGRAIARPLVIMIHGGFWRPEYDRAHTGPLCEAIADAGWTMASIEYRRPPGDPDTTVADVSNALVSVPPLVDRHDGRVILMGHSAGGHLSLHAASRNIPDSLTGCIALAPVADLQLADSLNLDGDAVKAFLGDTATQRPDLDPSRIPASRARTLLLHGTRDGIVPPSLSQSYTTEHPEAELRLIDRAGHFAVIDPRSDAWPSVLRALEDLST